MNHPTPDATGRRREWNHKREQVALALHAGKSIQEAMEAAGYVYSPANGRRMRNSPDIQARLRELAAAPEPRVAVEMAETSAVVDSEVAVAILMLESEAELERLARQCHVKPVVPGRWPLFDLVRGAIRHLRERSSTWSTPEVAEIWGVSATRVQQIAREGNLAPVRKNAWDKDAVSRLFVRFWRDENRRVSATAAETRVRDARARDIEVKTQERERLLIPTVEAQAAVDGFWGIVRTELAGLAAQCTRDRNWRRVIEDSVNDSLKRIANRCGEIGRALVSGATLGDALAATEPGRLGAREPNLSAVDGQAGSA
jgi:hypothetical protein